MDGRVNATSFKRVDEFENMSDEELRQYVYGKRVESKRVDEFANMSDEELRAYVYGNKGEKSE